MSPEELFNEHFHIAEATVYKLFPSPSGIANSNNIEVEDIVQYAREALWESSLSFDETKGKRTFKNYAIHNIRWNILSRLKKDCRLLSFAFAGVDPKQVKYVSLDSIANEDGDGVTYHELVPNKANVDVFEKVHSNLVAPYLFDDMSPKQKEVIMLKSQGYNCREIGEKLGMTRENARQLIARASKKSSKRINKLVGVR